MDLELMHHYSTDTYTTLEGTVENLDLVRNSVVNLALHHAYLMHALLAISALHLHHKDPSRCSLQLAAVEHFDNGLRLAQDAMNEGTQEHPIALFIFSSMAATYVLAKDSCSLPSNSGLESDPLDDFIIYFHLVRGVRTIVKIHWEILQNSWAQPFFEDQFIHSSPQPQAHDHPQMTKLLELVCGMENTNHSRIYTHALERLLAYMAALKTGPEASADARLLLVWLAEVEDEYLSLVSSKAPIALVILAHYAVLVNMRSHVWWTAGWPRRILTSIVDVLPREWFSYVQWPLEFVSNSDKRIIDHTMVHANAPN